MRVFKRIRKYKAVIFGIILLLTSLCALTVLPKMVHNLNDVVYADDDDDEELTYSLYDIGQVLGSYLSDATKPSDKPGKTPSGIRALDDSLSTQAPVRDGSSGVSYGEMQVGDAGAFIPYTDSGWLSSFFTGATTTYDYISFNDMSANTDTGGDPITDDKILRYAQYGYALGQLGFDETESERSINFLGIFAGFPILIFYTLSLGISTLFALIISVLGFFNPFKLLGAAIKAISGEDNFLGMPTLDNDNPLSIIGGTLAQWYQAFYDLAWYIVIPISFIALIVSFFFFRRSWQMTGGRKVRNVIIRCLFVALGVPLCGGCYTATLDKLADMFKSEGNTSASSVIASTFMDFESWAKNGRLAIPSDCAAYIAIDLSDGSDENVGKHPPTNESIISARATAYYINRKWAYGNKLASVSPYMSGSKSMENSGKNRMATVDKANWSGTMNQGNSNLANEGTSDSNSGIIGTTYDIILRFISGDFYYGSDYESSIKAALTTMSSNEKYTGFINDMFHFSTNVGFFYARWADSSYETTEEHAGDDEGIGDAWKWYRRVYGAYRFRNMTDYFAQNQAQELISKDKDLNGWFNTEEWVDLREDNLRTYSSSPKMPNIFANGGLTFEEDASAEVGVFGDKEKTSTIVGKNFNNNLCKEFGLSSMSLFNYLNTSFNNNDIVVYSSEKSTSLFAREAHKSVTIVGTGFISFLYYFNCLIMLGAICIIGFFYAFTIMFGNLKRVARLIASIPGAMLGSIRSIARVFTYTILMIFELIGTVLAYELICKILISLTGIIETPFISLASTKLGGLLGSSFWGQGMMILALLISSIVTVIFVIMSLRWRKSIVKALDEIGAAVIDKFLDTRGGAVTSGGSKPSIISKAAGGVAAGAGMGLGNRLLSGGGKNGSTRTASAGNGMGRSSGAGGTGGAGGAGGNADMAAMAGMILGAGGSPEALAASEAGGAASSAGGSGSGSGGGYFDNSGGINAVPMLNSAESDEELAKEVAANGSVQDNVNEGDIDNNGNPIDNLDSGNVIPGAPGNNPVLDELTNAKDNLDNAYDSFNDEVGAGRIADDITDSINNDSDVNIPIYDDNGNLIGYTNNGYIPDEQTLGESLAANGVDTDDPNAQRLTNQITGQESALESEQYDEQQQQMKKDIQKAAVKDAVDGLGKSAVGAAEVFAASETGNVQMAVQGAQNLQEGTEQTRGAGEKIATAGEIAKENVDSQVVQDTAAKANSKYPSGEGSSVEHSDTNGLNSAPVPTAGGKPSAKKSSVESDEQTHIENERTASSNPKRVSSNETPVLPSGNKGSGSQNGRAGSGKVNTSNNSRPSGKGAVNNSVNNNNTINQSNGGKGSYNNISKPQSTSNIDNSVLKSGVDNSQVKKSNKALNRTSRPVSRNTNMYGSTPNRRTSSSTRRPPDMSYGNSSKDSSVVKPVSTQNDNRINVVDDTSINIDNTVTTDNDSGFFRRLFNFFRRNND